jgi:hypothetical protein
MSFPVTLLEQSDTVLTFALLLRDGLSLSPRLQGAVSVTAAGRAGQRQADGGSFVFFGLAPGATDFAVRSGADTPYYLPADINVTLPAGAPSWPAFPDIGLADATLLLSDPAQPAAYRAQFLQACLTPSVSYPFDPDATLLRGTVLHGGVAAAHVSVTDRAGNAAPGLTNENGEFVLAFTAPATSPFSVTVRTHGGGLADTDTQVNIIRAAGTSVRISI